MSGDTVGYGPDPGPCIDLLRQYDLKAVAGNHDHAVAGRLDTGKFNKAALKAIGWSAQQLADEAVQFLFQLPPVVILEPFTLVHGSLRDPMLEYLTDGESAAGTFDLLETQFCLVGHSHLPFICREDATCPRFLEFNVNRQLLWDSWGLVGIRGFR